MAGEVITFISGKVVTIKATAGEKNSERFKRGFGICFLAISALLLIYKSGNAVLGFRYNYAQGLYLTQLDYGSYETVKREVDQVSVYESTDVGKTGYDPFPATPYIETGLRLIEMT